MRLLLAALGSAWNSRGYKGTNATWWPVDGKNRVESCDHTRGARAVADKPKFGVFAPQGWRMDLVHITDPVAQYEAMSHVAQEAERLGFDSVWLYDHFHTVPQPTRNTTFECWVSTAALA